MEVEDGILVSVRRADDGCDKWLGIRVRVSWLSEELVLRQLLAALGRIAEQLADVAG